MALYYFDSSALVKRYVAEVGTVWVRSATEPSAGNQLFVALIAGAEVVAAIAKRQRMGALDAAEAQVAIATFGNHFKAQYDVVAATREVIERAILLAPRLSLRGYDAVQLATALIVNDELVSFGSAPLVFVSADDNLNDAAAHEGLTVENPQAHPDPLDLT